MKLLSISVLVLAYLVSAHGFVCRNDDSVYYHADPSTACQVYHYCNKSVMTTLTCPTGQAFDAEKMKCMEAASVTCTDNEHHRMKRSIKVHTIAFKDMKSSAEIALKEIVEALKKYTQSTMPTIYKELEKTYFPIFKQAENDIIPLYNAYKDKFSSKIQKAISYAKILGGRLFQKVYQSWEMSNSTHLSIVSLNDIVSDVSKDLKPVLQLGRYLSAKALNSRHKRWADDIVEAALVTFTDNEHHRMKRSIKVHSIAIKDMKSSAEIAAKEIAEALKKFIQSTMPTIYEELEKTYFPIFKQAENDIMPLYNAYKDKLSSKMQKAETYAKILGGRLFQKVYKSWEISNSTHLSIVSLNDIVSDVSKDLKPVLQLGKYLSAKALNSRHKRWADDLLEDASSTFADNEHHRMKRSIKVHSIEIKDMKSSAEILSKEIAEALKKYMQSTMPTIYEEFEKTYFPIFKQAENDIMPLYNAYKDKVSSKMQKAVSYAKILGGRLFQKAYQSWEISNSTHLSIVSLNDIVSDVSKDLKPVLQLGRYLSAKALNSRHKRWADDLLEDASSTFADNEHHRMKRSIKVHSIEIKDMKSSAEILSKEIAEALKKYMQSTMPTIYEEFEKTYFPIFKQAENDIMPLYNAYKDKVSSKMQKAVSYAKILGGRLFQKAYQSWEMSNSTHLSIVSLNDVVSDVSKDLKPVLQLGRYLSAKALNSRHKRWANDIVRTIARPIAEDIFDSFLNFISGEQDTVMSKLVLPIVTELASDPETRFDIFKLIVALKSSFAPVMNEMYKRQLHDSPPGTIVHLPREIVDKAKSSFKTDSLPIFGKIMRKHLRMILRMAGENLPLITAEVDDLHSEFGQRLTHEWVVFLEKHPSLFLADDSEDYTHIHTKTITEIFRDLQPIKSLLVEMFLTSMSTSPNTLFKFFARADTVVMRLMFH